MSGFFSLFQSNNSNQSRQNQHSRTDSDSSQKVGGIMKMQNFFSQKTKKKELTVIEQMNLSWITFKQNIEKIIIDPQKYEFKQQTCLDEMIKPHLQKILDIILDEDLRQRESKTIGDCLEMLLKKGIIMELCAYAKSDNPQGLLNLTLKFLNFLIMDIRSTQLINHGEVHPALMQFLKYVYNSIKNDIVKVGPDSEEKKQLLDFLRTLTLKVYEDPSLVNFFFSESRNINKKGPYIPVQILLILLIKEEITEKQEIKIHLREIILMHLRLNDKQILKYIIEESEICVILIIKLGNFYQSLPAELELIANNEVVEQYPEDEDSKNLSWLNLLEQVSQNFPYEMKLAHLEFVRFCSFVNACAISIQHQDKLIENLCVSLFNTFLVEQVQPRLLKEDKPKQVRTAIQYLIQLADIFTNSQLIEVIYRFLVGFPSIQDQQVKEVKGGESFMMNNNQGIQMIQQQPIKSPYNHSKSLSYGSNSAPKKKESLIEEFNLRVQRINFEMKNMQSSYAINNPHSKNMVSPVYHKAAKLNELISEVLDSSLVSNDDTQIDYGGGSGYASNQKLIPEYLEQSYNLDSHKSKAILQCIFRGLNKKEEKISVTVLKLFDTLINKSIPSIQNHLYFDSLDKLIQITMYGAGKSNQSQTILLNQSSMIQIQEKFLKMFPLINSQFYNAINQIDLLGSTDIKQQPICYLNSSFIKSFKNLDPFVNEEKLVWVADNDEESVFQQSFISKSSLEKYQKQQQQQAAQFGGSFANLLQSDPKITLSEFDGQILQTPKNGSPPFPITYNIPEPVTYTDNEPTFNTDMDEDFILQSPWDNPKYHMYTKPQQQNQYNSNSSIIEEQQERSISPIHTLSLIGSLGKSISANNDINAIEYIDPSTFSQRGDFLRQICLKLATFLGNSPEENLFLTSIISNICNHPTPLICEETKIKNITSPFTLLHIFIFQNQFSYYSHMHSHHYLEQFSIMTILRNIYEKIEELMQDKKFAQLVRIVRSEGNIVEQKISNVAIKESSQFMEYFGKHKREIFAAAIFQEFLKEIAASLFTKELISDMIDSYEQAYFEDIKLECALEKFQDFQCDGIN